MRYLNLDEKGKGYYLETFKTEALHNLNFYKVARENHQRNIKKSEDEIEEQRRAISENEAEIGSIEAKLNNPDEQAKRLLFRDFKGALSNLLNGDESQQNARFGLKIQKQGPFIIEKPFSVSREGKKHTEVRKISVMKFKNNEIALEKFRTYLREGYNLPIDNLTFEQLKAAIEKFFNDVPKVDIYGEEYESEALFSEATFHKVSDPGFKF